MKKANFLLTTAILLASFCNAQETLVNPINPIGNTAMYLVKPPISVSIPTGTYNIGIGKGAGSELTWESYCVIVGHDSAQVNAKGSDMIWLVDWKEPYLLANPDIHEILCDYYNKHILTGNDDKNSRMALSHRIINRNNTVIGWKALRSE